MNKRYFSTEQIQYIYSNRDFFSFINEYFGNYDVMIRQANIIKNNGLENELIDAEKEILLRIVLASVTQFRKIINQIEKQISYCYIQNHKKIKGEIKGVLCVNEYNKTRFIQEIPRSYTCLVKERSYSTPENKLLIFVINRVIEALKYFKINMGFNLSKSNTFSESILLDEHLKYFYSIRWKAYFQDVISEVEYIEKRFNKKIPKDLRNTIIIRLNKRQIINTNAYEKLVYWFDKFQETGLSFIDDTVIDMLSYNEEFSDKLFELWVLYRMKEVFIKDYKFLELEKKHLNLRYNTYIFKVKTNANKTLLLYFQRGKDIFWNDEIRSKWSYRSNNGDVPLKAIPDIVVKYIDGDQTRLVLVDAKNRIRSARKNSEEIYKMLGYYENFSQFIKYNYGKDFPFYAALLFRNDSIGFQEKLHTGNDDEIIALSFSPQNNDNLNNNQFRELCRFILEVCGKEGNSAEVIGEYKNNVEKLAETLSKAEEYNNEDTIEFIVKQISDNNHRVIEKICSLPDLEESIYKTQIALMSNHFPHVWDKMHDSTKKILAMAEYLFNDLGNSPNADYAPICLEYCRALEVEMNHIIYRPFKKQNNVHFLSNRNNFYNVLKENRDLTLGECVFLLEKCKLQMRYSTNELRIFVESNINKQSEVFSNLNSIFKYININFRRKAAHTGIMDYNALTECRQYILGIGHGQPFYMLLDNR